MTTPRTIDQAVTVAQQAVTSQQATDAAVRNAAEVAALSTGGSGPAVPPAVSGVSDATGGQGGG